MLKKIIILGIALLFTKALYADTHPTGLLQWTPEEEVWYQNLPSYSASSGLAKLLPFTDSINASKINIRDELLQNGQIRIGSSWVNNIKNQNQCGSCVTNAMVTSMEYCLKRKLLIENEWPFSNYVILFSVPQALGCTNQGCAGANPANKLSAMISQNVNVVLQEDNNVTQDTGVSYSCTTSSDYVRLVSYAKASSEAWVKRALTNHFPVMATIYAKQSGGYYFCDQEVVDYDLPNPDSLRHEITIIGYDDNDNGGVWIVQNSWGDCHGDGILKIKYGKAGISKFIVVMDVQLSAGLESRLQAPYCYQTDSQVIHTVTGYNSQTSVTVTTASWGLGSSGSALIPPLTSAYYKGTRYAITRSVEIPLQSEVNFLINETKGVSAASPDWNKQSWGYISYDTVTYDSGTYKRANFLTFVYDLYLADGTHIGFWPCNLTDASFKYQSVGAGICEGAHIAPNISFTADATTGEQPATINFSYQNTGGGYIDNFLWNFGDGTTSTDANPTHVYDSVGTFTVSLIASNSYGADTSTRQGYIHILIPVERSYSNSNESGTISDVKARDTLTISNTHITSSATANFKAGNAIVIKSWTTVGLGAEVRFAIDPTLRQ
ncbi:MAG: C1 family peptidase [Chitinivibrionales bacterium]|nr:C1 family peptidase [Chitinivibrionales bacterium]